MHWLIRLRWIAVVAMAAAVYLCTAVTPRVRADNAPLLWGLVVALAVFTAWVMVAVRGRGFSQRILQVQIAVDVVILGAAIHLAGGMANPFVGLFVVHAVMAGLVLEPRAAIRAAAAISIFVATLTAVESSGVWTAGCLLDDAGRCQEADALMSGAWGGAAAILALGAGLVVVRLVDELNQRHREALLATYELRHEAERLGHAQTELAAQQEKLQQIVSCMADAVVFAAPDGKILLKNQAAAALWPDRPGGAGDLRVCHDPTRWARLLASLRAPKDNERHPLLQIGARTYDATYAAVTGAGGEVLGAVMVARDVTERLEEERLRMDKERLATIGRLAATLAHELNNPLSAIALFTQHALKSVAPGSPLFDSLDTVRSNASQCSRIVKDLLGYARQRPPERRPVSPRALIEESVRTLAPHCRHKGVIVRERIDVDPPCRIDGDPDQLRQVLVNLGLNAIDAMEGGGSLTFSARPGDAAGQVVLAVADTGAGIPEEDRERIFTAFYTTKAEGTGLGLAVVRDLVAAHHGRLELDSQVGAGTTFTITLPTAAPRVADDEEDL